MEKETYYEILGVSRHASPDEITAAKNVLAKQYHPDTNMKNGVDTTAEMQRILEAYATLSDTHKRAEYDRTLTGGRAIMHTFDLSKEANAPEEDTPEILNLWRISGDLYDVIEKSRPLLFEKSEEASHELTRLTMQALEKIRILREGEILEDYWHPDVMNWVLFAYYRNPNYTTSYLLTLFDEHLKKDYHIRKRSEWKRKIKQYKKDIKNLLKH